jgi:hypothetical protein
MDKISKILILILLILVLSISLFVSGFMINNNSGSKINHTLTKAICQGNLCQDYEIACNNKSVVSLSPTGNIVQFSSDWKDPRTYEEINNLC